MLKKYESFYESFKNKNHSGIPPHLYLNGRIFWCRFELAKVNGKRRFKRFSLRTDNYYEARQKMIDINEYIKEIERLNALYCQLKIEKIYKKNADTTMVYEYILSKDNDVDLLKQIKSLYDHCFREDLDEVLKDYEIETKSQILADKMLYEKGEKFHSDPELVKRVERENVSHVLLRKYMSSASFIKRVLNNVGVIIVQIQDILYPEGTFTPQNQSSSLSSPTPIQYQMQVVPPALKIGKILTNIQTSSNNVQEELDREKDRIIELLGVVGLTLNDDYAKFHTDDNITKITQYVRGLDVKNDAKRARIRYLKKIMEYACNESNAFGRNLLNLLPKFPKTPSNEVESHTPYTKNELITMFDPQYDFFKKEPDVFWSCMIALFCGARTNPASTLQFGDFPVKDDMQCISFNKNHKIKRMKTDSTIRTIPLHSKLIDMGFLDYINRHKKKRKATKKDFIFPDCITKTGNWNEHFFDRSFFPFLKELGIKKENTEEEKDHHDFHSFRTNINNMLKQNGVNDETFRNDIIGWEGSSVNQKHYSTHTLTEIQEQLEKLHYDFLEPAFAEWKKIMAKK